MSDIHNVDFYSFTFAAVVALLLVFLIAFLALAYLAIKQILSIRSAPCAYNIKDLQPGQILVAESAYKGYTVRVRAVQVEPQEWLGGYIETTDLDIVRVPGASLVLVQ